MSNIKASFHLKDFHRMTLKHLTNPLFVIYQDREIDPGFIVRLYNQNGRQRMEYHSTAPTIERAREKLPYYATKIDDPYPNFPADCPDRLEIWI